MENDDWVKFAWVLWASRRLGRQQFVLEHYEQAWRSIYKSDPPLDSDGGPVNFLHNPQYTCHLPIPWLDTALKDGPAVQPQPPAKQEVRLATLPVSDFQPVAGPSTFTAVDEDMQTGASPIITLPPSPHARSTPDIPPAEEQPADTVLDGLLKNTPCHIESVASFTLIKGGLFPGYREYLARPNKKCLRVVFPIIPQYHISNKNQKSTPYISSMDISVDDADAITQVDPQCLYMADDQGDCPEGQLRYFCSSWVCVYFILFCFLLMFESQLALALDLKEHMRLWDLKLIDWKSFSEAIISQDGSIWDLICEAHLVIGGVDFSDNFV
jgi:hypothetical protein